MKNYGDPLSNCSDKIENMKESILSNDETPIPVEEALLTQVN